MRAKVHAAGVGLGLRGDLRLYDVEFSKRLVRRDALLQSSNGHEVEFADERPFIKAWTADGFVEIEATARAGKFFRETEGRWQDADNGVRLAVKCNFPADDGSGRAESAPAKTYR